MANHDTCPTCGTKTSPLHRVQMRLCTACRRHNPVGFLYCGYCAAPMENTDIRARVAEVAAPAGGWPNLANEMLEVKFFLQQGHLDEAYELLSILQRRHPGHPELADLLRPAMGHRADADVEDLVDRVLASSPSLAGKAARRQATRWEAPTVGKREPTAVHDPVRPDIAEELANVPVGSIPRANAPVDLTHDAKLVPVRERTTVYRAVGPKPSRSGLTIAVDALQAPAPYAAAGAGGNGASTARDAAPAERKRDSVKLEARKRSLTSRKRKVEAKADRRGVAFGAGVLGRFGR
jgi:hypothetical protein